jgi:hypothetical protein
MEQQNSTAYSQIDQLSILITIINFYYPIVLSVLAIVGNTLSFMVFSSRVFKYNASGFFLKQKAFVDILNVCAGTLRFSYLSKTDIDILNISNFSCHFVIIVVYSVDAISSWLNVFISLDRLFLVIKPIMYKNIPKKKLRRFQIVIVAAIVTTVFLINTSKFFIITFTTNEIHVNNTGNNNNNNKTITLYANKCVAINQFLNDSINCVITLIIPFFLMTVSSSMMSYNLIKKSSKSTRSSEGDIFKKAKNSTFIKTVICLDICFLVCNLPRFIIQLNRETTTKYYFLIQLSAILKYSYYSLTIVLYLATNNLFRSKMRKILRNMLRKMRLLKARVKPIS